MATTAEKLVVELDAKIGDYKRKMREAGASGEKAGKKTAAGFKKADKEIKDVSSSLFKFSNVARGVAAAIAAIGVTQFADQLQIAENQLKNVTSSTEQFVFVQQELNRIAMETRQNVSELTSVYARFARAGQEAGFTQQEVLSLTESLTKAFKIEGNEVSEVNSILLQLTQSFRKGRIDGEEFRAVSEGSTQVLQALAKQMGVNIGELKELGAQGLLTPRELAKGLENLKPEIDRQFKDLGPTFSEVGTALGNVFAAAFKATGLQGLLGVIKREIVDFTNSLNESISEDPLTKLNFELTFLQAQLSQLRGGSNPITELLFDEDELERQIKALRERIATLQTEAAGVLDVTIKKGDTDLQLQRQAEFQEMLKELKLTGLETDEEIFIKTVELHKAMLDKRLVSEKEFLKLQAQLTDKHFKDSTKSDNKANRDKLSSQQTFIRAGMALSNLAFEDNKAINAGLVVADTAVGIQRALTPAAPGLPPNFAAAALIAATGAANLANVLSASRGGGTIGGGGGAAPTSQPTTQPDFQPETSNLEVSEFDTQEGRNTFTLVLQDGRELGEVVMEGFTEDQRQGRG